MTLTPTTPTPTDPRRLEYVPLDDIAEAVRNPKAHADDLLAVSVPELGLVDLIVRDERTGRLISGHGRLRTMRRLRDTGEVAPDGVMVLEDGTWTVPVVCGWRSADDAQAERALVVVNQATIAGGWHTDDLAAVLADLDAAQIRPTDVGFGTDDLAALLAQLGPGTIDVAPHTRGEPRGDRDDVPEPDVVPTVTRAGDVWLMGPHRVVCADCTDRAAWPADESAHLILADPPYFQKVDEEWDNEWATFDAFLEFLGGIFDTARAVLHPRGTAAVFCSPDFAWHTEHEMRQRFAMLNHIVWSKGADLGQAVDVSEMRRWRPRSERILIGETQHSPDALLSAFIAKTGHIAARVAYASVRERLVALRDASGLTNTEIDRAIGTVGMSGHYFGASQWSLPTEPAWSTISAMFTERGVPDVPTWAELRAEFEGLREGFDAERREFEAERREFEAERREFEAERQEADGQFGDVWYFPAPKGAERHGHATPKPVALYTKIVLACARPGDLIVDPFAGTGPTVIAAHDRGAVAHLIERDPRFVDVILARWQRYTGILPVNAATGHPTNFLQAPV